MGNMNELVELQGIAESAEIIKDKERITVSVTKRVPKEAGGVELKKEEIEIYVCRAKNVHMVLNFIALVMTDLGIQNLGELPKVDFTKVEFFMKLIANTADQVWVIAAELCSYSLDEVQNLDLDDALALVQKIVEVNKDFFLQSVLPLVRFALPRNRENQSENQES